MADVFLSYANEDAEHARALAEALVGEGLSVWWDHHIPPGKTWADVIEQEIANARCVIVLWTPVSVQSQWVRSEAREGLTRHVLVPVIGEEGVRLPLEFRHVQAAYLHDWDTSDDRSEYAQLLASVRDVLRRGTAIPEAVPSPVAPRRRKRQVWPWIAGGVVVLVLALLGLWMSFDTVETSTSVLAVTETVPATTATPSGTAETTSAMTDTAPPTGTVPPMDTAPAPTETTVTSRVPTDTVSTVVTSTGTGTTRPPIGRPDFSGVGLLLPRCTAFLVGPDLVLTYGRCASTTQPLIVRFGTGRKTEERTVAEVLERDALYALLRLDRAVSGRKPLSMRGRTVKAGEPVVVVTQPADAALRYTRCTVIAVESERFTYDCGSADAPAYGSPVFGNMDVVLLGMHRGRVDRGTTISAATPVRTILRQSAALRSLPR